MGKGKRKSPIPQKGPNYAQRNTVKRRVWQDATRQTYQQYMTDVLILTLNDPAIMGKDVFGRERIKRVLDGWGKKYDAYFEALTKLPEADYKRERMDGELQRIMQDDFQPFMERYDWMPEIHTGVKK